MNPIQFTVYGSPIAQPRQRHRVIQAHGHAFATNYTPAKAPVNQWKSDVKTAALPQINGSPLWDGPVSLDIIFYLPRPASKCRKKDPDGAMACITKPDTENLLKSVMDALTGVVYHDDRQICDISARKMYHEKAGRPRAEITLEELRSVTGEGDQGGIPQNRNTLRTR